MWQYLSMEDALRCIPRSKVTRSLLALEDSQHWPNIGDFLRVLLFPLLLMSELTHFHILTKFWKPYGINPSKGCLLFSSMLENIRASFPQFVILEQNIGGVPFDEMSSIFFHYPEGKKNLLSYHASGFFPIKLILEMMFWNKV